LSSAEVIENSCCGEEPGINKNVHRKGLTMSTNILGNPETLRRFWRGPFTDLMIKLTGENGPEYQAELNKFLRKQPCWEGVTHVIDCSAEPFIPDEQTLIEHNGGEAFVWDPARIELFHPTCKPVKREEKHPELGQVEEELRGKPVCNANVMDYLLRYPRLVPDEWKGYRVFFFGTKYRFGQWRNVRYLSWHGVNWEWGMICQINTWYENEVAAVFRA
jgi:hypothetical protein